MQVRKRCPNPYATGVLLVGAALQSIVAQPTLGLYRGVANTAARQPGQLRRPAKMPITWRTSAASWPSGRSLR